MEVVDPNSNYLKMIKKIWSRSSWVYGFCVEKVFPYTDIFSPASILRIQSTRQLFWLAHEHNLWQDIHITVHIFPWQGLKYLFYVNGK